MTVTPSIRWCDYVEPSTAPVPCGGEEHRVTWRRGKLVLEDHNLGAEQALLALGGEPCACMRVLKMWRDQWKMPPELLRQMMSFLGPNAFLMPPELEVPRQLGKVRNWERIWRRESYTSQHGRLLEEDIKRLSAEPLRRYVGQWAKQLGLAMAPSITVRLAPAGQTPTLVGSVDGRQATMDARLGVRWIVTVWGRGVALVNDGFVLEVMDEDATPWSMVVRAARWEMAAADDSHLVVALGRLTRDAESDWSLEWMPAGYIHRILR